MPRRPTPRDRRKLRLLVQMYQRKDPPDREWFNNANWRAAGALAADGLVTRNSHVTLTEAGRRAAKREYERRKR